MHRHEGADVAAAGEFGVEPVELSVTQLAGTDARDAAVAAQQSESRVVDAVIATDMRRWINEWNTNPKPFVWTKTADQILETLAAYC